MAGMIRGSKCWTLEMLDELWEHLTTFLNEVCINLSSNTFLYWGSCFKYAMENKDPRRMYRPIQFLRALINNQTSVNTLNEASRWYLIQQLDIFEWRIPSIWYSINEHVKKKLDHPFKVVRDRMVIILSLSLRFDLTLFHGKPTRQPSIDQSIDEIRERLHQTIETYEKTSLVNMSDQLIEINSEVRQMLNFIETALIQQLEHVCASPIWHARQVAIEFVQTMIFCNLFNARPYANRIHDLVFKSLFDEQFEVRIIASTTLSGLYQCDYIQVTEEDLKYFHTMSKTNYFTKINTKKITSTKDIVKRHGGRSIWTKIIRNKKVVKYLFNGESFDFHYQFQNRFIEPSKLYLGDESATRCVYNTMNKTSITLGGESDNFFMENVNEQKFIVI
ncbi:unnamed protein product [Rotaria sordida]|uniref:Uncharacterized protein n=2 Tax=Rotaria sordida TaxID=392033 RepID=A0A814LPT9_9BILA|nr:unnamed protein product [Rotaria sordida]